MCCCVQCKHSSPARNKRQPASGEDRFLEQRHVLGAIQRSTGIGTEGMYFTLHGNMHQMKVCRSSQDRCDGRLKILRNADTSVSINFWGACGLACGHEGRNKGLAETSTSEKTSEYCVHLHRLHGMSYQGRDDRTTDRRG